MSVIARATKASLQEVVIRDDDGNPIGSAGAPLRQEGWAFDAPVSPAVTNGAYSAGDIMGGLLTFADVSPANGKPVLVTGAQIVLKSDVAPVLTLVLFNADPAATIKTDNAAYSLDAADAFKAKARITDFARLDHGTPNSFERDGLSLVIAPGAASRALYGLLIDHTGVTLTGTDVLQVTLRGLGP